MVEPSTQNWIERVDLRKEIILYHFMKVIGLIEILNVCINFFFEFTNRAMVGKTLEISLM
jgi:hypothetical protein